MSARQRYPAQITCRVPLSHKKYIDSKKDPSEWIREAILEKIDREKS